MPAAHAASVGYRHPFDEEWWVPENGEWGNNVNRKFPPHAGVDYNVAGGSAGKTIRCVADGYVRGKNDHPNYGNELYVEHDDGMWSHYCHMVSASPRYVGERILQGGVVGYVGKTGHSFGEHLHLEMAISASRCNSWYTSVDPITFINLNMGILPSTITSREDEVRVLVSNADSAEWAVVFSNGSQLVLTSSAQVRGHQKIAYAERGLAWDGVGSSVVAQFSGEEYAALGLGSSAWH